MTQHATPGAAKVRSSAHNVARAIRDHSKRAVRYHTVTRMTHYATVIQLGPDWAMELHDSDLIVDSEMITLGANVTAYQTATGIHVGDTIACVEMADGDWLWLDVISD